MLSNLLSSPLSSALRGVLTQTSSSTAAMPDGALGIWWMDEYQSSPRPYVPNSLEAGAVSTGLMTAPRRRFASDAYWRVSQLTVTDSVANDQNAVANQATTLVSSGTNWYLTSPLANTQTLAAGTYTIAAYVRWRGTGTTDFKMGPFSGLSTKTASASWARFSVTFVHGGGAVFLMWLYTPDGTSSANFEVCDADLFLAGSDPGAAATVSHLYLGRYPGHNFPTYSAGVLNCASGCAGSIQFPTSLTFTEGSVVFLWRRTGNGFNALFAPILAFPDASWAQFAVGGTINGKPGLSINGTNIAKDQESSLLFDPIDSTWAVGTMSWDAAGSEGWIGDVRLLQNTTAIASRAIANLDFGFLLTDFYAGYEIAAVAFYDRKLTAAEVSQAAAAMRLRTGITADPQTFAVFAGDSITSGFNGTPGYAYKYVANANPKVRGANWGVGGQSVSGAVSVASTIDAILPADKAGREFRLHTAWGTNDLGSGNPTPTQFTDTWEGYLDARRTAGWDKLTAVTVISRMDGAPAFDAQHLADRTTANATILAWAGTTADGVVDFSGNADLGGATAATNTTYFSVDQVHPNNTGHALMETIATPVFNAL